MNFLERKYHQFERVEKVYYGGSDSAGCPKSKQVVRPAFERSWTSALSLIRRSPGVIGPNGAGKTTLVNILTGFIKPDHGQVFYKGRNISGMTPDKIANLGLAGPFRS